MSVFSDFWTWITTDSNWHGSSGIPSRLGEHIDYTVISLLIALAIGLPIGMLTGHTRRFGFAAIALSNAARAIPTLGIVTIIVIGLETISSFPVLVALVVLAIPSILVNTDAGIRAVDEGIVDAARGMGMRSWQVLFRVELPAALRLVLLGVRTAAFQIVATATIAAFVGLGGLGRYIIDGQASHDYDQVVGGAVLVSLLAIFSELGFLLLARLTVSPGVRGRART